VTAVVRHASILNDVTPREAALLGLEEVARVTDTGNPGYGLVSWVESEACRRLTASADMVVSKGIANLETLSHRSLPRPVLFLYRAKCGPSARAAAAAPGTTVIWWKPV
ncbi:MAG: ARMT1-like domain-containing protein, partial [Clostridia bacterium]